MLPGKFLKLPIWASFSKWHLFKKHLYAKFKVLIFIHHLLCYLLWKKLKYSGIFYQTFDKPNENKSLYFPASSSIIIVFPAKHVDYFNIPDSTVIKIVTIYGSELEPWTESFGLVLDLLLTSYVNFNYFPNSLGLNSIISKARDRVKWSLRVLYNCNILNSHAIKCDLLSLFIEWLTAEASQSLSLGLLHSLSFGAFWLPHLVSYQCLLFKHLFPKKKT